MQELPIRFKIGSRWYSVQQHHRKHTSCHGRLKPTLRHIEIFAGRKRMPRTPAAIRQTFWHEMTHAILYDMQHDLWDNEYFVEEFSKRLSQAIDTSEFKDG